jgi:histidinol phosphatase-like enzyme (inositol monophosphatase family)
MSNLQERLEYAVKIAKEAGAITLEYFGKLNQDQHDDKSDGTPVTVADRASETHLRNRISEKYPDDAILGEEFDDKPGTSGYEWVIDPIDGTISFVQGVPLYGTMLACLHDGTPEVGVVHMPVLDETVYAADGLGCWYTRSGSEPTRARMSETRELGQSIINTTSMSYFQGPELRSLYEHLDRVCKYSRGWSDAYAWVLLATGRVDSVIEPDLKLWDFAAAIPIVRESGGIWSDLHGNESLEITQILAANPDLHRSLMDEITKHLAIHAG